MIAKASEAHSCCPKTSARPSDSPSPSSSILTPEIEAPLDAVPSPPASQTSIDDGEAWAEVKRCSNRAKPYSTGISLPSSARTSGEAQQLGSGSDYIRGSRNGQKAPCTDRSSSPLLSHSRFRGADEVDV